MRRTRPAALAVLLPGGRCAAPAALVWGNRGWHTPPPDPARAGCSIRTAIDPHNC